MIIIIKIIIMFLDLTSEQASQLQAEHKTDQFPGLASSLPDVVTMMTSRDPAAAITSKALTMQGIKLLNKIHQIFLQLQARSQSLEVAVPLDGYPQLPNLPCP